ncbi:MAG: hypothetical protein LBK60_01430 [Verrucomicrobiales bacterium]|jgi:hypothetical protein|nr:hypothetical protein [Verrucomicrobiales bacterium]
MAKDLGIKENDYYGFDTPTAGSDNKKEERIIYPNLELRDAQIDGAGAGEVDEGDTLTLTVKARVSMKKSEETDKKKRRELKFDVLEISGLKKSGKDDGGAGKDADGDDEDSAVKKRRRGEKKVIGFKESLGEKEAG